MANEKISDLPSGGPAQPSDLIPIARGGANYNLSASAIAILGNAIDITIGGNVAGVPALISSGTLTLAGGQNVTLSQVGNAISMSAGGGVDVTVGGNVAGAPVLVSSGTLFLAGGNNVTLSQNGQSVTISGGQSGVDITLGGNTAGVLALVSTGTLFLAGGPNVTVSQNGNSVSIAGAAAGGIAATLGGNTAGVLALVSSGTLFLAGGNNVTLSQNGQSITISANTAAAAVLTVSAGTTSGAFGGVTFSNSNNVSFGLNNGTITASASQSVQTQASGAIAGTSTGATNISVTLNSLGIAISGPTETGIGLSAAGQNVSAGVVTFSNSNNVSFGMAGSVVTASVTVALSSTGAIYNAGNTTGQSSSSTFALSSLNFSFAGLLSGGWSNSTLVISAPNTTGITQSLYATGNTTQSSSGTCSIGSLLFNGANGVSVGISNGSIVISGATGGGGGGGGIDVSLSGNTAGALALISSGTMILAGGPNITLSQNGQSVSISGSGGAAIGMSTMGNTAGTTHTFSAGTYVFVGSGPISLSQSTNANGGTLSINAPATSSLVGAGGILISTNGQTITISGSIAQMSFFQPLGAMQNTTVTQIGLGSIQIYPALAPFPFTASRVDMMASVSAAVLAASTEAQTLSMYVGLYSLNGATLSLASSGSQSYAWTNSSGNSAASITGLRRFSAPINVNYTGGFDLFVGIMSNTTFVNTNGISLSNVVVPIAPIAQLQGLIGQVPANSMQFVPGQGVFSVTSAALPSSMGLSAISGIGSTGSNAYGVPVQFINVTA